MFDEITTQSAEYVAPPEPPVERMSSEMQKLETAVRSILDIEERITQTGTPIAARFSGKLLVQPTDAYDVLDAQLKPLNYFAYLSQDETTQQYVVQVIRGRLNPKPRHWGVNAILLVLTLFSMMFAGASIDGVPLSAEELITKGRLLDGLPYALSLLLILGAHELGHYFAARYHKVNVTLPYFIPMPIGILGTLGAFIQLRAPIKTRNQLFDVGVAGPLAGLFFAIPILIIGVITAEVEPLPTLEDCDDPETCAYMLEGNSILYSFTKFVVHGRFLPGDGEDMILNQLAFAGWTGLLVTSLNLIPVGQLDGGHIMYTLFGGRAQKLYMPILFTLAILTFLVNPSWFIWMLLLLFFGRVHAIPLDDISPLSARRRWLGYATLFLFFLIFIPNPLSIVSVS